MKKYARSERERECEMADRVERGTGDGIGGIGHRKQNENNNHSIY